MTDDEIKTKRRDKTEDLVEQFGDFDNHDLQQLRIVESQQKRPRANLVDAIEDELQRRGAVTVAPAPASKTKADRVEPPDWQKPDYAGPLTCDQAYWRNTRLVRK